MSPSEPETQVNGQQENNPSSSAPAEESAAQTGGESASSGSYTGLLAYNGDFQLPFDRATEDRESTQVNVDEPQVNGHADASQPNGNPATV